MEHLKELVKQLEQETDVQSQILILQKIGATLINEYEIQIGDLTIEPLFVEAYYHHKKKFEDSTVYAVKETKEGLYARSRQQNNWGKLFIHYNDWGIDICLTGSTDYYLSYLIKNALVNGEWQTQKPLGMCVCKKCSQYKTCKDIWDCQYKDTVVLQPRSPQKNGKVIFVPRVNIANRDLLGALSVEDLISGKYDFTLPAEYRKQWKSSVRALLETTDQEKAREKAKEYNNNSRIEDKYWELAKESLSNII